MMKSLFEEEKSKSSVVRRSTLVVFNRNLVNFAQID